MSTTTEPIVTEQVAAAAPSQVVEAPQVPVTETEQVAANKIEEPTATVADEVAATEVAEATEATAPAPTTSKSNSTNRLSLFLGKAKTFVDKKVHEKKPAVPKKDTEEVTVADVAEPIVASSPVVEEPVAVEEHVAREVETAKVPKTEKRKSILAGIFRSKVNLTQHFIFQIEIGLGGALLVFPKKMYHELV